MKNAILLAKNQEYVSQKCKKSYFSTKYRISAQNRIRPLSNDKLCCKRKSECEVILGDIVSLMMWDVCGAQDATNKGVIIIVMHLHDYKDRQPLSSPFPGTCAVLCDYSGFWRKINFKMKIYHKSIKILYLVAKNNEYSLQLLKNNFWDQNRISAPCLQLFH